jgi:hypothetical protein
MESKQYEERSSEACRNVQTLLSDYIDNSLSARQTWDVEKHLSLCVECAAQAQQLQVMVEVLHAAPQRDTADDFMAKLHARLDVLEPELVRSPSFASQVRDWVLGLQDRLKGRSLPAVSMALALSCVVALLLLPLLPQNGATPGIPAAPINTISQPVQRELDRHIADVANDPLGDVAAAKLTTQLNPGEDLPGSEAE